MPANNNSIDALNQLKQQALDAISYLPKNENLTVIADKTTLCRTLDIIAE